MNKNLTMTKQRNPERAGATALKSKIFLYLSLLSVLPLGPGRRPWPSRSG